LTPSTLALKRSVRLLDLVMIGAGTAIGASIFSVLGPSAKVAGSGILVAVLIAALPMTTFGLIYAFMSSAWPRSGASYEWQRTFIHPLAGFVVVWLRIMGSALLMSVMGSVLVNYLSAIFPLPIAPKALVFSFFTMIFLLNYVGVAVAARAQTIVMLLLLIAFGIFIGASAPAICLARMGSPTGAGWAAIISALPLMIHLFLGIESCTEIGEEVKDPERNIPLGLALALALSGLVYFAIALTSLGLIGPGALAASKAPLLTAAQTSLGHWAPALIGTAALLALSKSMNSIFLVYSRLLFAMGRSRVLPPVFARIHPRFGTPQVAIIAAYVGSSVCLLLPNDLIFLFLATTIPNMMKYFSTCLASLRLVRYFPAVHAQARLRFSSGTVQCVAVLGMLCAIVIASVGVNIDWKPYALLGGWLLCGLVYWRLRFKQARVVSTAVGVVATTLVLALAPLDRCVADVPRRSAAYDAPLLTRGAIAAPDRYSALAAKEILGAGGNAVDAAVAVAFVLAVTYPEAGNLGGGGFMTLYVKGHPYFLDYRETAPGKATSDLFVDAQGDVIPGLSTHGNLSVAVPGTVRGMVMAHERFGRLPWARDLAPAIRLAKQGFTVSPHLAGMRQQYEGGFRGTTNFDHYFANLTPGRRFQQPELAATLERVARNADREFYDGKTSQLLLAQLTRGPRPGLISAADLSAYKAVWREPITGDWHGYQVITAAPPSSGGIALLQLLLMKADAAAAFDGVALNTPQYIHLVSELEKRVFADRAQYLGDPDFIKVPTAALTDPAYLARRAAQIDLERPSALATVQPGLEKPQTTHFSIIDRWGNAVANTYTLNGWFGCGTVVEGAGFLLNDEMDDFSAKPGAPNQLGVVGAMANAIAPDKRPLSSMSPTILTRDGKVTMILGTPGGSRIFTSIFQVLVDVYDFHLSLPDSLARLRFHHQLLPENTIFSEPYAPFSDELTQSLVRLGYRVEAQRFNGDIEAIQVLDHTPVPASDPRGRGVSMLTP
jgi:gamma-glutamyltranspeptidase / glutathione hydrolase